MTERKVSFETLGCRYNRYETAEMAYELADAGYRLVKDDEEPDVVVINTCTVTDKSDTRCRAAVRRAKTKNPKARVVLAGCYVETNPEEASGVAGVDLALGAESKFSIATALGNLDNGGEKVITGGDAPSKLPMRPVERLEGRTNTYINVQGGCDEKCSFCIVRVARGASRSADPDQVVDQIRRMVKAGVKEVVLSGVNLGDYGSGSTVSLAGLMSQILDNTGIERIRLSSINPNTITDDLIEVIAREVRVCRHLHIPLQSGSDKILQLMRRPYSTSDYEKLLDRVALKIPGIGIGVDVMVGFPGETEADFKMSYDLLERSPVMMFHVFSWSPREKTEAFMLEDRVTKPDAKKRSRELKELSIEKSDSFRATLVGRTLKVLVENSRNSEGRLKGFSDNYAPVVFNGPDELKGKIIAVAIHSAKGSHLWGEPVA